MPLLKSIFERSAKSAGMLVTLLTALSIIMITAIIINRFSPPPVAMEAKGSVLNYDNVRTRILNGVDCLKSMPEDYIKSCQNKTYIPLVAQDGTVIVPANDHNGSRVGTWNVRASCYNRMRKLLVEVQLVSEKSEERPNLNIQQETSWHDMFPGILLCNHFYTRNDEITTEDHYNSVYLEYYPTQNFKANGGNLAISVTKIHNRTSCEHTVVFHEKEILSKETFILRRGEVAPIKIRISKCGKNNRELTLEDSQVMFIKQGRNLWRLMIADNAHNKRAFDYQSSIWTIMAQPMGHH
jgi:hypothetical protein